MGSPRLVSKDARLSLRAPGVTYVRALAPFCPPNLALSPTDDAPPPEVQTLRRCQACQEVETGSQVPREGVTTLRVAAALSPSIGHPRRRMPSIAALQCGSRGAPRAARCAIQNWVSLSKSHQSAPRERPPCMRRRAIGAFDTRCAFYTCPILGARATSGLRTGRHGSALPRLFLLRAKLRGRPASTSQPAQRPRWLRARSAQSRQRNDTRPAPFVRKGRRVGGKGTPAAAPPPTAIPSQKAPLDFAALPAACAKHCQLPALSMP